MASQQPLGDSKPLIMDSQQLPEAYTTINISLQSVQMASQQLLGDSKPSIMDSQQPPEASKTINISL